MGKPTPFPGNLSYTPVIRRFLAEIQVKKDAQQDDISTLKASLQATKFDVLALQSSVAAIQTVDTAQTSSINSLQAYNSTQDVTITALSSRVTAAENDIKSDEQKIVALQYADASIFNSLNSLSTQISWVQEKSNNAISGYKFGLSDSILGTVPKLVCSFYLPEGDYAAPTAEIGCPASTSTATLSVKSEDELTEVTIIHSGIPAWTTATAGFTITVETQFNLFLSANSATSLALIKGFEIKKA